MRRGPPHLSTLAVTLILTACNDEPDVRIDGLPSGLVEVTNSGEANWQGGVAWTLQEDLRLGTAVEDGGPDEFGFITALAVDGDGRIYVVDGIAQEVRVFGATGTHLYTIGQKGPGPGEFSEVNDLTLAPDGSLWVTDLGSRRYAVYSRDGELLGTHARPLRAYVDGGSGFDPEGRLIDWEIAFPPEEPGVVPGARILFQPVRFAADMSGHDPLPPLEFERELVEGSRVAFFSNRLSVFQDRSSTIWFAHTREYRIWRRTASGDTTLVFTLPAVGARVGDADRDAIRKRMASSPTNIISSYLDGLPDTKPVIRHLFGDNAGHIFVVPELEGVLGGSVVDVFTDQGEYRGRVTLPESMSTVIPTPVATDTHLYVVVLDQLDIPYVSRLRISKDGN